MSTINFKVLGDIVGKQRPRFNRYTGRTYTPGKTHKYENAVKVAYITKYPSGMWCLNKEQPLSISLEFHFQMPSSWSHKKKERHIGSPCLKHIDLDNCYKSVTDSLNGVAYPDDSQICFIDKVSKVWDETEYVLVTISEVAE